MIELKRISKQAVPAALQKALRYRLLNEPLEAESICRDVLIADPDNQEALATLLLALTDQFETQYAAALGRTKEVLVQLKSEYERAYYSGIINERWAKAEIAKGLPSHVVAGWLREAMRWYEKAEVLAPPDNPDAVLRWNACARLVTQSEGLEPQPEGGVSQESEASFGDEMPPR